MSKAAAVAKSKTKGKAQRERREAPAEAVVASPAHSPVAATSPDRAERELGRWVALGLPAASIVLAIGVGVVASVGPAILILAAGALLGCIALLWASVRTLSGDAPLPEDLEAIAARSHAVDGIAERKSTVLRALKDLEHEHEIGKIDDEDFAEITRDYREQAKELMREMDADVAPMRARAEEIAAAYLARRGLGEAPAQAEDDREAPAAPMPQAFVQPGGTRRACPGCTTSNDADAAFCKKCGRSLSTDEKSGDDDSQDASDANDSPNETKDRDASA